MCQADKQHSELAKESSMYIIYFESPKYLQGIGTGQKDLEIKSQTNFQKFNSLNLISPQISNQTKPRTELCMSSISPSNTESIR